ncbi:sensor histidine kinase [Actinophytocola oryzae]|uniref:Signal transduction histidine-protein kinase/phosphatase MprB n=1 Tax=Actinophytocola oryzae TaxID=502181 RepID=A0A4R7VMM6_9PSEU|nr:HAMP domain-containing sensor histidine kinase [Actinophytocola oryzae]TDV50870.1 signal transduction histidine kinase [Actinophytocola oryzae]
MARDRRKAATTLWVRVTAFGLAVAGVMALVAGFVSVRMVSITSREAVQETLADQADVVAAQLSASRIATPRVTEILSGQGISLVRRGAAGGMVSADPDAVRAARRAGLGHVTADRPLHGDADIGGTVLLVEGRAIGDGGAVALVREPERSRAAGRRLVGNVMIALAVGMFVAAVAGLLLARLLARPLRRTAEVAVGMSHGRRDLRVPPEGPRELVDVGESLNALADALARSEARQREFLLSISHELRTPLTAVRGFAESLADGVVTGDEVVEVGQTIEREAERLDGLVTDLLDLARLGADDFRLDLSDVDLTALLAEAARVWESRCAAAGVELRVESPTTPTMVNTDPRRLRQVLDGLAANALRATPPGAPVVLSLYVIDNMIAVLSVRDGGPGLSDEDYQLAFRKGVLHSRYQGVRPVGTGIGLALVHGLVTRLGGQITAGRAPEGGARFSVRLQTLGKYLR